MMESLTDVRDRLQEEFDNLPYPVQWGTFTLGRIATLETQNAALLEALIELRKITKTHTILGRGDWLNHVEEHVDNTIRKHKGD